MTFPVYPLVLAAQAVDGTALTNTTTPTNVLHGSGIGTIPAGALQIGSTIKMTFMGRLSTVVTTPGNLTLILLIGAGAAFTTGAVALNTTAQTNDIIYGEIISTVRTLGTGTGCTMIGFIRVWSAGYVTAQQILPATAPAVGSGFDSTVANTVNLQATFSVANAANSLTIHQCLTELKV